MPRITAIETAIPRGIMWNPLLVRVHTDDGVVGCGETYYTPPAIASLIHDWMAARLLGADALAIESHWRWLYERCTSFGHPGAEIRALRHARLHAKGHFVLGDPRPRLWVAHPLERALAEGLDACASSTSVERATITTNAGRSALSDPRPQLVHETRQGRPVIWLPVCMEVIAGLWLIASVCIERIGGFICRASRRGL
jgi:Mandelate racemase / muconate lactonizing enzyme, N-terminal domain